MEKKINEKGGSDEIERLKAHISRLESELDSQKEEANQSTKQVERLKLAIEASNIGLFDWNMETGEAYFNSKYFTMLGYNPDEMDYMKEGKTEQEKTKRFLEFWKSKDPSPGNDENEVFEQYFSRVAFANENFSHYVDGWNTDRGMVFIILGVPSNIERHPFEYNAKPYEIWQYYELNKSFVFTDQTGFGDYRLVTPLYGDLFRYRY